MKLAGQLALLMVAAGCNSGPVLHEVTIRDFLFQPDSVRVAAGDTIRWRNEDPVPHTATRAGSFDSGAIATGADWSMAFAAAGRFEYICALHPTMRGVVIVE